MSKQTYGNSGDAYIITAATVANTTPVVSTIVDLRRFDCFGLVLSAGGGAATLDGAWKIEMSNDFTPAATNASYGQAPNAATAIWVDVTASAMWVDAIAAVAHATASSTKQAIQPKYGVGFRSMRVTFTGTTGSATVSASIFAKSWSA